MNTKVIVIVLLGILFTRSANAQKISVGFDSGIGSYAMKDLHNFNSTLVSLLIFDAKVTSDFPSYWYYRPFVKYQQKRMSFGFNLAYESTGSRISSSDYSGSYRLDSKIDAYSPALSMEYLIFNRVGFNTRIGLNAGTHFTKFKLTEELLMQDGKKLLDNSINKKSNSSENYFLEPQAELSYSLSSFSIAARIGYSYSYNNMKIDELSLNGMIKAPSVDWSGYRFGLSLSYLILDWSKKVEVIR